eukprot:gene19902-24194_t
MTPTTPSASSHKHHRTSKYRTADGDTVMVGCGEGVSCRRDASGRLIVDIDITQEEGDCVYYAQNYMSGFDARPTQSLKSDTSFSFHSDPQVIYAEIEPTVRVAAVVEVFGLAFTQGVNEMQTLANLSSSRDCLKQGEINFASLVRLKGFFGNYRAAL